MTRYDVVVPTVGRPSLVTLLGSLAATEGQPPDRVVVVDDRTDQRSPLGIGRVGGLGDRLEVVSGRATGPAAARNDGWRVARAPWVVFLDDDVVVPPGWADALSRDLEGCARTIAACQGRIVVPLPVDRPPTDWERNVAGLASARWATADMAYRRSVLAAVGGFDERFPRAYREDADLALRVLDGGWGLEVGDRWVTHPVRPAGRWVSIGMQRGNADDALMRRLHGPDWRRRAGAPPGRLPTHVLTTIAWVLSSGAILARRRGAGPLAVGAAVGATAGFAAERIAAGPRDRHEVRSMVVTSLAIPPVAVAHRLVGGLRAYRVASSPRRRVHAPVELVLFDRDGTLVHDVPYNGDPEAVRPVAGAAAALERVRARGIHTAIVSNQSGVGRGVIDDGSVEAVNARVAALLGPFDAVAWCPHPPDDRCGCRKPAPGLVTQVCSELGVDPARAVVVGDIGSDVRAARAAGCRSVLVPTPATRFEEIAEAPVVVASLAAAVDRILAWTAPPARTGRQR